MTALAVGVTAHPLGNFSINQYSRLETGRSQIKLREVLDMAEIPTLQEKAAVDTDGDGVFSKTEITAYADQLAPQYAANLSLHLNGEALPLRVLSSTAELRSGSGDLSTLRLTWEMVADVPAGIDTGTVAFQNNNNQGRVGWNEIVVSRTSGINIYDSSAFGSGASDELNSYPQDAIESKLAERTATYSFTSGVVAQNARPLQNRDGRVTAPIEKDRLSELIKVPEITPLVALFGLLIAFGLGAFHAMSPGHGKTIVGAYLVGSRGTPKHAIILGLVVTVTHTIGVFALGLITLFASSYILPERIMPFLSFVSGLIVFFIGVTLFKDRLWGFLGWNRSAHDHGHTHEHGDDGHTHEDGLTHSHGGTEHTHLPPKDISMKSLLGLGISGGLLPCPSALVLMLAAISAGRIGYGLILTVVFSFGLAATLTTVGMLFLFIGNTFGKSSLAGNKLFKALPVFSAVVVACMGAVICYTAIG